MSSCTMDFAKDQSAGYLVNHVARLFEQGLKRRIRPLGLSPGTFPALLELWEHDGLTQKELVIRLDIEQPTMANTLARMERDGLVIRKKDDSDGRVQRIWLTDRARELQRPAVAAAMAENADAMASLADHERELFVALMRKIIKARSGSGSRR
nr:MULTISPECIES: MarR family transcriptional regulator [unclassified Minwuia]